jgi:hypothetical protein
MTQETLLPSQKRSCARRISPHDPADLPFLLPPWLTARVLDCSEKTLERRRTSGVDAIPFVKIGRRVYYPRDKLVKYLEAHTVTSTAAAKKLRAGKSNPAAA